MSYRVKTVASMTGIPRETLLAWERRYDILTPARSDSGHRMYSDADVAILRRLKRLVDDGLAIGEAVRLVRRALPGAADDARPLTAAVLDALLAYDRATADALMPRILQLSFQAALDEVYMPILREIGARWEDGRAAVAQEHFASGWCREQLFAMFHQLGSGPASGPVAVCALPPGEQHELGLLAIAIRLMLGGFRVTWLGADLPVAELCDVVAHGRPRLVCVSTVVADDDDVVAWARAARAAAPSATMVAFGGPRSAAAAAVAGVVVCPTWSELARAAGLA